MSESRVITGRFVCVSVAICERSFPEDPEVTYFSPSRSVYRFVKNHDGAVMGTVGTTFDVTAESGAYIVGEHYDLEVTETTYVYETTYTKYQALTT